MPAVTILGDLEIRRVIEMEAPLFDPLPFFPTLTQELLDENRGWLEECGALDPKTGQLVVCIQSYVVRTPHHNILIDSCVGNDKQRAPWPFWHMMKSNDYMRSLRANGLTVEDIDIVMCTHLHLDHVGWNTRLENGRWVPTFPNARYIFSGHDFAHAVEQNAQGGATSRDVLVDSVLPVIAAGQADLVRSDHVLNDHVRLVSTPGHSPDHFSVEVQSGQHRAVMTGDMMHSPIQARFPELSMRSDFDQAQAAMTRRSFLEHHCEQGTLVCT